MTLCLWQHSTLYVQKEINCNTGLSSHISGWLTSALFFRLNYVYSAFPGSSLMATVRLTVGVLSETSLGIFEKSGSVVTRYNAHGECRKKILLLHKQRASEVKKNPKQTIKQGLFFCASFTTSHKIDCHRAVFRKGHTKVTKL